MAKKQKTNTKKVPRAVRDLADKYLNLKIAGKTIQTPYYRNVKRVRAGLRVLIGKGSPEEIIEETLIYAKLRKIDLEQLNAQEIREFMLSEGIGIDCSGLVSHLLNTWLRSADRGGISRNISYPARSLYRKLLTLLRPIESTGADILTNAKNTEEIKLSEVLPGDLIRSKGLHHGNHILFIYSVEYINDIPKVIKYIHSLDKFQKKSGVKFGEIQIINPEKELKDQNWLEKNEAGEIPAHKQLLRDYEDNGLRRLNCLKKLQKDES
jgi:hypothetical protein